MDLYSEFQRLYGEENNTKKELIGFLICTLLVTVAILPATGTILLEKGSISAFHSGNILYVGGSGPGNYTNIQDAIDDASDGDTVFVYSKTYYENLIVDVSIELMGEDRNNTVIDGQEQGDVIKLTVDGVKISGFTLRKCKGVPLEDYGAVLAIETDNHTITNNKICDNKDSGIHLEKSHNNVISGNYIVDNCMHGIYLLRSSNNLISNNIVENSDIWGIGAAIRVQLTSSANNIIVNNYVKNNGRGIVDSGLSNNISNNDIVNNGWGIALAGELNNIKNNYVANNNKGIYVNDLFNNISNNTIINNKKYGLKIVGSQINITNNEIINNNYGTGILLHGQNNYFANNYVIGSNIGIMVSSKSSKIIKNEIKNNGDGVIIEDKSNIIKDNTIESNIYNGICISGSGKFNIIEDNTIDSNKKNGIYLVDAGDYNVVVGNIICNNKLNGIYSYDSRRNIFCYNNISLNNGIGVYLVWDSTNNVIKGNNFSNNLQSINISDFSSFNNNIFHNNFFDNEIQAYDKSNNSWDDGYPSGGNYWDDYNGTDANGDDIGDTPYNISGGDNQDRYPLMFPYVNQGAPDRPLIGGKTSGKIGEEYTYIFITTDPDGDDVYYYIEWGDNETEEWIGPYSSGEGVILGHTWHEKGTYTIRAKAKDTFENESDWSDPYPVRIGEPPDTPQIAGETNGKVGVEYEYTFNTTDPDDDNVYYWIEWFEGDPGAKWEGPYASGEKITRNHTWHEKGTYTIRCKAKDIFGEESDWGTLSVTMPKNKQTPHNTVFYQLLEKLMNRFPILERILIFR